MTASIYQKIQLVQITPDGEWYVAISHSQKSDTPSTNLGQVLAVDTGKDLTFASEYALEELTAVRDVAPLNRFITVRLEFIPGMLEASAFNLLANALYQNISDVKWRELDPQKKLASLVSLNIHTALGRGLHQTLTTDPVREEILYVEHDYIAHGLQSSLIQSGLDDEAEPLF